MLRISGANWIHEIKHDGYRRNLAKFATHADARARP
jgi:ATP-dependent DNA ligase